MILTVQMSFVDTFYILPIIIISELDPCISEDLVLDVVRLVFTGDDVFWVELIFCCEGRLLGEAGAGANTRDFLIPNIDENAAVIVFRVFIASWPRIEYNIKSGTQYYLNIPNISVVCDDTL